MRWSPVRQKSLPLLISGSSRTYPPQLWSQVIEFLPHNALISTILSDNTDCCAIYLTSVVECATLIINSIRSLSWDHNVEFALKIRHVSDRVNFGNRLPQMGDMRFVIHLQTNSTIFSEKTQRSWLALVSYRDNNDLFAPRRKYILHTKLFATCGLCG